MSFLAIIIALVLVQAWGSGSRVHEDDWFYAWQSRITALGMGPGVSLALTILAPALVVYALLGALESVLFGLPWIGAAAVLLLYAFGRRDFHELMERYQGQSRNGDFEGAYLTTLSELGWADARDNPGTPVEVHALVQQGFVYEGFQRWFAVLFYFVVLGPAGALAYRLLQLCRHDASPELTERCLFWLDWAPARLLAATFSLTGDFIRSRDKLVDALLDGSAQAGHMLYDVACSALGAQSPALDDAHFGPRAAEQNHDLGALLQRSAVCWVVVISLLVMLL